MRISTNQAHAVQNQLNERMVAYSKSNVVHPNMPKPRFRDIASETPLMRRMETYYAMAVFWMQPEYLIYQTLWDQITEVMGMGRVFMGTVRYYGADGDTLSLTIVDLHKQQQIMIPCRALAMDPALKDWVK